MEVDHYDPRASGWIWDRDVRFADISLHLLRAPTN
jgi:hypothetical protein